MEVNLDQFSFLIAIKALTSLSGSRQAKAFYSPTVETIIKQKHILLLFHVFVHVYLHRQE